ncbi:MAG: M24 family metallopeptidase, partial [Alphaproteobacteria bacterium]|nr:M24 family metallopeptidase [Alphaproteobacteria bacterium]
NSLRDALPPTVDLFIVPHGDDNGNEMLAPADRRLEFVTGFTGSAGTLIVTKTEAHFFTDGRYTLQAKDQIDTKQFHLHNSGEQSPLSWLSAFGNGKTIGADPWLHTVKEALHWEKIGLTVQWFAKNPVDAIWTRQPRIQKTTEWAMPPGETGESAESRAKRMGDQLDTSIDTLLICDHANASWMSHVRGDAAPYSCLARRWTALSRDGISVHAQDREDAVTMINQLSGVVGYDPRHTPVALLQTINATGNCTSKAVTDPCTYAKAIKTPAEQNGFRAAHVDDAIAVITFLDWLRQTEQGDENEVDSKLLELRAGSSSFLKPSFPTIAGIDSHGAIIHYRATEQSNRSFKAGQLLLVDSGGHYLGGTTDVTRTMLTGNPKQPYDIDIAEAYTAVLRGLMAISSIRFPKGTTGTQIDILARMPLWELRMDYAHGTGHGVGHVLSVHEGPHGISQRNNTVPLAAGMVVSLEPGVYIEGKFGIRLENLAIVQDFGDDMLGFETLTMVPFDRRLIITEALSDSEIYWIDEYHALIYHHLVNKLEGEELCDWMALMTAPLLINDINDVVADDSDE